MSLDTILWLLAVICFVIAAFASSHISPRINLVALGLALGALTFIVKG
jgi:hypothetical protein